MAKFILLVLALVGVAIAKPMGGVVSHGSHVSTHMVTPHLGMYGLGYGLLGYPGVIGHSMTHHTSIGHHGLGIGGYGLGMKGIGMYPGLGLGYGYFG